MWGTTRYRRFGIAFSVGIPGHPQPFIVLPILDSVDQAEIRESKREVPPCRRRPLRAL